MSFLTNVYGARLLLGLWVHSGLLNNKPGWFAVRKSQIRSINENVDTTELPTRFDKIDFVKLRNKVFILSGVLIVAGIIAISIFRMNLGIDFSSGTRVEVQSKTPLTTTQVENAFTKLNLTPDDVVISGDKKEIGAVRMIAVLSKNEIATLKADFKKQFGYEPNVSTVSPTVGKELAKNAFFAVLIASIGIILYVSIRFEAYMAIAAIAAILHDAFFMIAIFSITRLEVDLNFIAAILTIIGYSNHDTIVTFDRVRENMQKKKRLKTVQDIADVVNISIRQTLTRSFNTVLTVLITVVCLMIFGSPSIRNFSIALFVGLIVGVYSSVFVAGSLWYVLKCKELKKKGVIKTVKEKRKYSDQPQV